MSLLLFKKGWCIIRWNSSSQINICFVDCTWHFRVRQLQNYWENQDLNKFSGIFYQEYGVLLTVTETDLLVLQWGIKQEIFYIQVGFAVDDAHLKILTISRLLLSKTGLPMAPAQMLCVHTKINFSAKSTPISHSSSFLYGNYGYKTCKYLCVLLMWRLRCNLNTELLLFHKIWGFGLIIL